MSTKTISFWTDAPRTGFSAACIERFGVNFNCDHVVVRSCNVPVRRVTPMLVMAAAPDQQRRASRRGGQARRTARSLASVTFLGGR